MKPPPELEPMIQRMMVLRGGQNIEVRSMPPLAINKFDVMEMCGLLDDESRTKSSNNPTSDSIRLPEPRRCRPNNRPKE